MCKFVRFNVVQNMFAMWTTANRFVKQVMKNNKKWVLWSHKHLIAEPFLRVLRTFLCPHFIVRNRTLDKLGIFGLHHAPIELHFWQRISLIIDEIEIVEPRKKVKLTAATCRVHGKLELELLLEYPN